jgi:hypothetical protein
MGNNPGLNIHFRVFFEASKPYLNFDIDCPFKPVGGFEKFKINE